MKDHFERHNRIRRHFEKYSVADDYAVRLPKLEQQDGIDVIRFQNEWQIKLLFEDTFLEFVTKYIESHRPPYKMILQLDAIQKITLTDLGNLVAVFTPFIETNGIIVICHLQADVEKTYKLQLLDCDFFVAPDLKAAIEVVKKATVE